MFATDTNIYIIEAKHYRSGTITREILGIYVQKLLDIILGSYDDIGHMSIKPVLVSGQNGIDTAASQHAVAWGILLIAPGRPTPFDILYAIQHTQLATPRLQQLAADCERVALHLWRPLNNIIYRERRSNHPNPIFLIDSSQIYDAQQTTLILEEWNECLESAEHLHVLPVQSMTIHSSQNRRPDDA